MAIGIANTFVGNVSKLSSTIHDTTSHEHENI